MSDSGTGRSKGKYNKQGRVLRGRYNQYNTFVYIGSLGEDIITLYYLQY